jgi:SAM-dependent methyltransferase
MDLKQTQSNWDLVGGTDPLYGVLSHAGKQGGRWDEAEFFATGVAEIGGLFGEAGRLGLSFPRHRALDFGCAVGRLTQALAPNFDEVVGVDIAPSMLALAERFNKFPQRCRYVLNENPDLRLFPDASFDLVYSNIVLQHMAPKYALAYVADFVRLLSPGGLLVFQLPESPQYGRLRLGLKGLTPKPLLRLYRRLRYGAWAAAQADIEMNGVPEPEVLARIQAAQGRLRHHGGGWYWVDKQP